MSVMQTRVAVFPIAADTSGFWQLSGYAPWISGAVPGDSTPFFEAQLLLQRETFGVFGASGPEPVLVHQTSDSAQPGLQTCNFVAVYDVEDALVVDRWPGAQPIEVAEFLANHGRPAPHASDEPPTEIRRLDVLMHLLRHLAFLLKHDATARRDIPMVMRRKLGDVETDLFKLFEDVHETSAALPERRAA